MHFLNKKFIFAIGTGILLLFSNNGMAENVLNTIVVSASKVKQSVYSTPTFVQVIDGKQIKQEGNSLFTTNLLDQLPGVSVLSGGGFAGVANMFIRGIPVNPKIMIDGVDISSPYYPIPRFNFNSIVPMNVNRMEILQGAQSGLWGANAASGAVNILTAKGSGKPHINFSQTYGSFATKNEYIALSGIKRNISFYISGSSLDTNGIPQTYSWDKITRSYSRGHKNDGYHRYTFYTNFGYDFGKGLMAHLILDIHRIIQYNDICKRTKDNPICPNNSAPSNLTPQALSNRYKIHFYFVKFNVRKKLQNVKFNVEAHLVQNYKYFFSPPKPCPWWKGKKYGSSFNLNYKLSQKTTLVTGIEYGKDKSRYDYVPEISLSRYHTGAFAEILQRIGNLKLQFNSREDHYETFGNNFTYKVGAEYLINSTKTIIKSNYGTGFVPPSLLFLYGKQVPHMHQVIEGNPDLSPEKSKTFDFGFIQILNKDIQLGTTFFWSKVNNLIVLVKNSKTTYKPVNLDQFISKGLESSLTANIINPLKLKITYTYTQSGYTQSGMSGFTRNIPNNAISGSLILNCHRLYAQINGKYVGSMYDNSDNQIGRYTLFNLNMSYKINKNFALNLYVQNLFNKFYYSPWNGYGYSSPPRSIYLTLSGKI